MTHTYQLIGMTCSGCEAKVKNNLLSVPDITSVNVSKETNTATIIMEKHIAIADLQKALGGEKSKYQITATDHNEVAEQTKNWLITYKPILLIFIYITLISSCVTFSFELNIHDWMNLFMAQFFLVFSFFKFLNLKAFAESYSMYDIVAQKIKLYGYIYPFIELALGIAFLISFNPTLTNIATIVVMGISSIGVVKSVLNKQKIQCACLGAVFNLPMSTVTIIEDFLMVAMAAISLLIYI